MELIGILALALLLVASAFVLIWLRGLLAEPGRRMMMIATFLGVTLFVINYQAAFCHTQDHLKIHQELFEIVIFGEFGIILVMAMLFAFGVLKSKKIGALRSQADGKN